MQTTTIDLRPQVKNYEANGRQKLSDVYFRIDVPEYTRGLNDYSKEAGDAADKAVAAFDKEVVDVLLKDGWTLRREKYGPGDCPQLKKGAQYLYCHPHNSHSPLVVINDADGKPVTEFQPYCFRNIITSTLVIDGTMHQIRNDIRINIAFSHDVWIFDAHR